MLNWFATILLWGLVYSWMILGIYFLAQQSLIKKQMMLFSISSVSYPTSVK